MKVVILANSFGRETLRNELPQLLQALRHMICAQEEVMGIERFTPEFKEKAVRQIVECSYSLAQVSARVGVSAHSPQKWVKAVSPDKSEKQASQLLVAKS